MTHFSGIFRAQCSPKLVAPSHTKPIHQLQSQKDSKKEKEEKLEPNVKLFCLSTTKQIFESPARPSILIFSHFNVKKNKTKWNGQILVQMSCLL